LRNQSGKGEGDYAGVFTRFPRMEVFNMKGIHLGLALYLLLAGFLSGATAAAGAFSPTTLGAWVQYTASGVEARAVVTSDCPTIEIDGAPIPMALRAGPTGDHPNNVCTVLLPEGVKHIVLDEQALPVPKKKPRNLVVVGDTGCRVSDSHGLYQACDNDSIWPFKYVAQSIRDYEPDAIIYTGDYIYRESACPDGNQGCVDTPYGDNQATWEADWLGPAHPTHLAAPLVLIRGNHETCSRAGTGWFRYLDARDYREECINSTAPWAVELGELSLGVMDTATVEEFGMSLAPLFADQLRTLDSELGKNAWIATHRPFWGFGADDDTGELTTPTVELQEAVRLAGLPSGTRLIVSAHIHLAELLQFDSDRPPQLVVANGGTQLVPRVDAPQEIDGVDLKDYLVLYQYGFVAMKSGGGKKWKVSFRDIDGRELERCKIKNKKVKCPSNSRSN
jgi:hypothetical protein